MIQRARFWSCRKFCPRVLTGETRIFGSVVLISESFIKQLRMPRWCAEINPFCSQNCVNKICWTEESYSQVIRAYDRYGTNDQYEVLALWNARPSLVSRQSRARPLLAAGQICSTRVL